MEKKTSSVIDDSAVIEDGVSVGEWSLVASYATLGSGSRISQHSVIETSVSIGGNSSVWCFCRIRENAVIGSRSNIGDHTYIGPGVVIGDDTKVGNGCQIHHPAVIGNRVFIGPNSFLGNDRYPQIGPFSHFEPQPVIISDDAIISASVDICGGVTVHRGAFIGMASNVLSDVPAGAIAFGNPATVQGWRTVHKDENGEHFGPLRPTQICAVCGRVDES